MAVRAALRITASFSLLMNSPVSDAAIINPMARRKRASRLTQEDNASCLIMFIIGSVHPSGETHFHQLQFQT